MEIQDYDIPENLHYDKNHFWLRQESNLLVMGLDDFGQKLAGDIVFIQLPPEGKNLIAGKVFAKMESGKWVGKIYAPIDGELTEINEELELEPGLVNDDCYGEGWIFKFIPKNMDDLAQLIHGKERITEWMLSEIEQYKDQA